MRVRLLQDGVVHAGLYDEAWTRCVRSLCSKGDRWSKFSDEVCFVSDKPVDCMTCLVLEVRFGAPP